MGNELDKPILTKTSYDIDTPYIKFGLSSVQGWKTQMEDYSFHMTDLFPNSDKKVDLFGIFSGEGGPEIAKYVCNHFPEKLKNNKNFGEGKYSEALKESFIEIDNLLNSDSAKEELKKICEQFMLNDKEEIDLINKTCGNGEILPEGEIEQIKCIKEIINPRNLINYNIQNFTGCSGIVILITNSKIYIANVGNNRCIPIDKNLEIISEKITKVNLISEKTEKNRVEFSQNFIQKKFYPEFLDISRGFGFFDYKENKWLKPEDQAVSPEPDIIEINYEQCKYLIIGSKGLFIEENDEIIFNKYIRELVDYFMEKIKNNLNKKFSNVIEGYFDRNIPKNKNPNIDINYQNFMDNITCFVVELLERPKIEEKNINEEKKEINSNIKNIDLMNENILKEKQKMESFKKSNNNNNKSMKNLFSFLKNNNTNNNNMNSNGNNKTNMSKFSKNANKGKKMESSSSFTNIFKKKQNK